MDPFEIFVQVLESPWFEGAAVVFVAALFVALAYQEARSRQRIVDFMEANGFRLIGPISTLWLARVIERWSLLDIGGHIDGRWVNVRAINRQGRYIVVTAAKDLTSGPVDRKVTLGAWTRPKLPALLEGGFVEATGRYLRVHVGGADFVPYVFAAVAYAKTLEEQPVKLDEGRAA